MKIVKVEYTVKAWDDQTEETAGIARVRDGPTLQSDSAER